MDPDEIPSAPFAPFVSYTIPENFMYRFASLDNEERAELLFEIEERIAIMMFDAGLSLDEASRAGVADTLTRWFGGID